MAQSIFDLLGSAADTTAKPTDSGSKLESIMSTGMSGKADVGGSVPKSSRLGERAALGEVQQKLDQVQQSADIQKTAQKQESQQIVSSADIADKQLDQAHLANRSQYLQQSTSLLNEFSRGNKALDMQKDGAKLEQMGFTLRMADDKYIFNLQQEGQKARLDNDLAFREQLTRDIMSAEYSMAEKDGYFKTLIAADDADFRETLQKMEISQALDFAKEDQKAARTAGQFQAVTGGVTGILGGASKLATTKSTAGSTAQPTSQAATGKEVLA